MRYSKIFLAFFSLGLLAINGCKKGDKYYYSPNDPTNATANTLLTSMEVSTMNLYEGDLTRSAGVLMQHGVGIEGQASETQVYSFSELQLDNVWGQMYQTLQTGVELNNRFGAANPHYRGLGKIISAMNLGVLTDFWGDVPYTEATSDNKNPAFDSQESVLASIQTLLDEAIADLATAADDNVLEPGADDLIYNGDLELWTKAAWTLKARYLNRLSNKPSYNPAAILDALSKGISSNTENAMAVHGEATVEHNQWYDFLNQRAYIAAGGPLVDSMKLRPADQRLAEYFGEATGGGIKGSPVAVPDPEVSFWGDYLAADGTTPTPMITYTEALFIKAEVLVRQGNLTDAATALNDAIKASASAVTGGAFDGAAIATYTAGTVSLSRVMYEKWIAMFGTAEPFHDYRRTGLPAITPNPNATTDNDLLPGRLPISLQERNTNLNIPSPLPKVEDKVWYAQ